jgi:hypothetical protein
MIDVIEQKFPIRKKFEQIAEIIFEFTIDEQLLSIQMN